MGSCKVITQTNFNTKFLKQPDVIHLLLATVSSNEQINWLILCRCQTSPEYKTKHRSERKQKNFELQSSWLLFASYCQNHIVETKFWIKSANITQMWIRLINNFEHGNGNFQSFGKQPSTRKWNLDVLKISILYQRKSTWFQLTIGKRDMNKLKECQRRAWNL